jgi:hypothetical protein
VLRWSLTIRPSQEDEHADTRATSISTSPESACPGRAGGGCPPDGGGVCFDPSALPVGRRDSLYRALRAATAAFGAKLDDRSTRRDSGKIVEILRVRDRAIQTRNARLLDALYTTDCPCLEGDKELIRKLRQEQLVWRGINVSLDVQKVERVNDQLWTVSALVTTSPFEIVKESGASVRRIPQGQEISRFALARPIGQQDWLLGQASVIEERD